MIVPYGRRQAWRWTPRRVAAVVAGLAVLVGILAGVVVAESIARAPGCDTSLPSTAPARTGRLPTAALQGHPTAAAPAGQDVVFVALRAWGAADLNGIEVLRGSPDGLRSLAVIQLRSGPAALALSPDGGLLFAALDDGVAVLDSARAAGGDPGALLGTVSTGTGSGTAQLLVAANRYLFTADEAAGRVSVLDLRGMAQGDFGPAVHLAAIDVDMRPTGLSVSPDGRYVYVVSQMRRPGLSLGPTDALYGLLTSAGVPLRAGTLSVIDTRRVELDPERAVIARVSAGCAPARVAASPDGRTVWVTARQSNELLAFRADQVQSGRPARPVARVPMVAAPEGLALTANGRFAIVAGSGSGQTLRVVDTAAALNGRPSTRGAVAVSGQSHEIELTPDQRTAYVAANDTSTLTTVNLAPLLG
jgi:DNA-binding beta-propeller fold protein YncE